MASKHDDKTELLVSYIVERLSGKIGKTRLVKLIYLADLKSRELRGEPISSLDYVWHNYGPWDSRLEKVVRALIDKNVIQCETYDSPQAVMGVGYSFKKGLKNLTGELTPGEKRIADIVIGEFARTKLKVLLEDVVYETGPMKAATRNRANFKKRLKMSDYNGTGEAYAPFTFDEVAEALANPGPTNTIQTESQVASGDNRKR